MVSARRLWADHTRPKWLEFWDALKRARAQILAGLLIGVIISAAGYWAWSTWQSWRVEELTSVSRTWPPGRIFDEASVQITTKCTKSILFYTVEIIPRKSTGVTLWERADSSKAMTDRIKTRLEGIRLQFVDKDGLPTAAYEVPIDEFVRMYSSSDERLTSLEARGTRPCDPASYVRSAGLKVRWLERRD